MSTKIKSNILKLSVKKVPDEAGEYTEEADRFSKEYKTYWDK